MGKILVIILILSANLLAASSVLASGNRVPNEDTTIRVALLDNLEVGKKYNMKITMYTCWTTTRFDLEITRDCDGYLANYKIQPARRSFWPAKTDSATTRLTVRQFDQLRNLEKDLNIYVAKNIDDCAVTTNYRITLGEKTITLRDTDCQLVGSIVFREIF